MVKSSKTALLKSYKNELLRFINANPEAIYKLEWGPLTNGFDGEIVKYYVMGIEDGCLMEELVEHLKLEWCWYLKEQLPCIYSDAERRILKYASKENPVRFSVYMDEMKRMWEVTNCKTE